MTRILALALLLATPAAASDWHLDLMAGYAGTRNLGFEDELAPVLGATVEWSPDNRWSVDADWLVRYADKIGDADSVQTTLMLRGCYTTRKDAGLRLCAGSWSSSLTTESWEKVGAGILGSLGYGWRWDEDTVLWSDIAWTPSTNVAPDVSGLRASLRLQREEWGALAWTTRVSPVDGSLPSSGLEVGFALIRRVR